MRKCAYCTAMNREEAIFCSRCRRPLQPARASARELFPWLLFLFVALGLALLLFIPRAYFAPGALRRSTPTSSSMATRAPLSVAPFACVGDQPVQVRRGPGTQYETIGGLPPGACLRVLGRDQASAWLYIISEEEQIGWMAASLLADAPDLSRVSVRDHAALAQSSRPTLTTQELAFGARSYLTRVAATSAAPAPAGDQAESCFDYAHRVGDRILCRVERAYCDYFPASEGDRTVCSDRPGPDQTFELIVPSRDWSQYDGQCVLVSGLLQVSRGMLMIEAIDRSQISPCQQPP